MNNRLDKRRARNEEQKSDRRQALLRAASELFERSSYETVTMAEVAKKAGVAKGTVFFYFKTKEELFLALHEQLLEAWFGEVDAGLKQIPPNCSVRQVATFLAHSLQGHTTLIRLLAIAHTTLENNVDVASMRHFKQSQRAHMIRTGRHLEDCLPFLRPGQGVRLLLHIDALIIGLHHLAHPQPMAQEVLQTPEMQLFRMDFINECFYALSALLHGIEHEAQQDRNKIP